MNNVDKEELEKIVRNVATDAVYGNLHKADPSSFNRTSWIVKYALCDRMMKLTSTCPDIKGYSVSVNHPNTGEISERNIPPGALPGDAWEGGRGIVLSSDGDGRGVVLAPLSREEHSQAAFGWVDVTVIVNLRDGSTMRLTTTAVDTCY